MAIGDRDVELAREVARPFGDRVLAALLDVTDPASWRDFLKEPDAVPRAIVDVNLHGLINGTKAVAPGMVERGSGHIINVASAVGRVAVANGATCSASKHGAVGFSEALRAELEPHGIDVTVILPTVVQTELAAGVSPTRGVRAVTVNDVSKVIEAALLDPKPELWVPRWTQGLAKVAQLLPRRVQAAVAHALKADSALTDIDQSARADYEARVRPRSD